MNINHRIFLAVLVTFHVAAVAAESVLSKSSLPHFEPKGVVFSYEGLRYRPHDDVIFPSVVATSGRFRNPLGRYYLYYAPHAHANPNLAQGTGGINGSGFDLYLNKADADFTKAKPIGRFMEASAFGADNPSLMSPCFFEENGALYLFVNIGPRLKNTIALAVAKP